MPRLHDYVQSSGYHAVPTQDPRFGHNEIGEEQLTREFEIFPPGFGRNYQFSASWSHPVEAFQAEMEQVFEWLSENNAGPWSWQEEWGNNGHSLGVYLHIERENEQAAFNKTWGHAFTYRPDEENDLDNLAVLKNVLPPKKNLLSWLSENGLGFELNHFVIDESGNKERQLLIAADTEEKTALFQAEWGHLYKPYIKAVNGDSGASGDRFLARYVKAHVFIGDMYFAPERTIPEDFRDYLKGRCDFSAVRTIQAENRAAGLPNMDFTCK